MVITITIMIILTIIIVKLMYVTKHPLLSARLPKSLFD